MFLTKMFPNLPTMESMTKHWEETMFPQQLMFLIVCSKLKSVTIFLVLLRNSCSAVISYNKTFYLLKSSDECCSSNTIVWFALRRNFPGNLYDSRANNPGASMNLPCLTWNKSGSSEKYTLVVLLERPRMFSTYSEKSSSLLNDDWFTNITTAHLDLPDSENEFRNKSKIKFSL